MLKESERLRLKADILKRKAELYSSLAKVMSDKSTKRSIDNLMHAPKIASKVSKIGWSIFWIPEPTMISNAIAIPMIIAGKLLEKHYDGITVKDVYNEAENVFRSLRMGLIDK